MAYEFYITRADQWAENDGREILIEEWLEYVRQDDEFELVGKKGAAYAVWKPDNSWLDWEIGNVFTRNATPAFIEKMARIAGKLKAKVQGESGEVYAGIPELNQVLWSLQALAQPAKVQLQLFLQVTKPARKLAVDFIRARQWLLGHYRSELQPEQLQAVEDLYAAIEPFHNEPGSPHWTDQALQSDEKWQQIRQRAGRALAAFGWSNDEPPRG